MRQWRLIYHVPSHGAHNMAVDESILSAVSSGQSPLTLRLYAWSLPCLSLGYGQTSSNVDFHRVADLGWHVVRRPTGGRAILHADELTYSVTLPANHPLASGEIVESYRRISQALLAGLRTLGLSPQADPKTHRREASSPVCFDTPSHYEITVNGRKLVGSAQVRRKGGLLQHGSLPLAGDLARICNVLAYTDETSREQAKAHVHAHALTLAEAIDQELTWQTVANAIVDGFRLALDVDFVEVALTPDEQSNAAHLEAQVYSEIDWRRKLLNSPALD